MLRKAEELVHIDKVKEAKVDVIKRFSGGGTVIVDEDTVFSTLIMNAASLPHVECYPRPVMRWTEGLLQPIFCPYGNFRLACHGEGHLGRPARHCPASSASAVLHSELVCRLCV